ncbi:MAG: extracellular solute-binding protein [Kiloniellales bacterium]|nr:extracellular solute-binding protein [Kiloniellales bacterium]
MRWTRRDTLKAGVGGLVTTAALGVNPRFVRPAGAQSDLAEGMTGGPSGFAGAERFQYNESMSEGRAIEGMKRLVADGKAPKKIVMLLTDGAIGQITKPFPEGAPSVKEVWERETGVEIDIVGAPADKIWTRVLQDVTTSSAAYDIYTQPWNNLGDLVEAKGAADLSEFVDKYQPDWGDPERGTPSPQIEELLYKYNGKYYSVSLDGDFQTWVYNKSVYEDPKHRAAFEDKYGHSLAPPRTWEESDHISEFFTGAQGIGEGAMYGNGNMMSPFWGLPTFYARFASMAAPNLYWFDDDGNPNLDSDLGIQCAEEHLALKQWSHPDILSWTYAEAYGGMANGLTAHISTYTNLAKFYDRMNADGTPASPIAGNLGAYLPPGRMHDGKLVRRSVIYYNINAEVSSQSAHPEAAYLFLQWLSSTRTFSWMAGNPGGYFDPFQKANLDEPLVVQTYHDYLVPVIRETISRSAPTLNFAGQTAMDNALDEELQAALTGQKSAEDAMKDCARRWKRIIRRKGEDRTIEAIRASRAAWPTLIDEA